MFACSASLVDVLPQIAYYTIDSGLMFKNFRMVSRLFLKIADRLRWRYTVKSNQKSGSSDEISNMMNGSDGLPGDIYFADHRKTILKKFNMVPNIIDLSVESIPWDIIQFDAARTILFKYPDMFDFIAEHINLGLYRHHVHGHDVKRLAKELQIDAQVVLNGFMILRTYSHLNVSTSSKLAKAILKAQILSVESQSALADLEMIKRNPDYPWDYHHISSNYNLTKEFYLANKDKGWRTVRLCLNTSLDFDFICTLHPTISFCRIDVPWEYLIEFAKSSLESVFYRFMYVPDCVVGRKDRWEQLITIMKNKGITFENEQIFDNLHATWKTYDPDVHLFSVFMLHRPPIWVEMIPAKE